MGTLGVSAAEDFSEFKVRMSSVVLAHGTFLDGKEFMPCTRA
jgi:hypothetical protein